MSSTSPSPADLPNPETLLPPSLRAQSALPLSGGRGDRPVPGSLTSSAARITTRSIAASPFRAGKSSDWQTDAWEMYNLIGEQRFLANTLAGRASQARLFVGRLSHLDPLADPEPVEDARLQNVLDSIGKTAVGRAQILMRMVINFFIPGEGYLVGIPPYVIAKANGEPVDSTRGAEEVSMDELEWRMLSTSELVFKTEKSVELRLAESGGGKMEVPLDHLYLIRAWRSHPERAWEADSPTRSSLPVLRELVALTMAIGAQADSRLAGAGIFVVPDSARKAMLRAMGESEESDEDPLADAIVEAMSTAISDRSSAASFVPIIITAPDDVASSSYWNHISFSSPFDKEMRPLRDEAIRRLALGQDAPPELLLGTGGMNHWGAWLVREDVVTTHLEPPLALFCDAVTTQYLRPMMLALGYSQEEADEHVIWYDVSHMVVSPNRGSDAKDLYAAGELSGEALRTSMGFDENDAPPVLGKVDPAVDLALQLVAAAPSLMQAPGLPALVEQIRQVQSGDTAAAALAVDAGGTGEVVEVVEEESDAVDVIPETANDDADVETPSLSASAVRKLQSGGVSESFAAGRIEERRAAEAAAAETKEQA